MQKLLLILLAFFFVAGFDAPESKDEVTIIVELEEAPQSFINQLEARIPRLEVVATYNTIFNGVAVKGTASELEKLARMNTIVNQYPVQTYKTLKEENLSFSTDVIRKQFSLSFTGKGVKVGIIDTGIDYHHPDLTANYQGGFDTVDFDEDPMESKGEGETMHGTHVAGVIAANGKMKGIAPESEVYAYRALGPGGVGSSVQVIAAIEEAVEDGMDVINLSLGNDVNGPDWPTTHAVNKAVELGTSVVVAAGNSGPDAWTVGSPATSSKAITVGASALPSKLPVLSMPGERRRVPVQLLVGSSAWNLSKKYPLVLGGTGEEELGDARGKVVLFERGNIPFSEKAFKAHRAGAVAVIIYNNEEGIFQGSLEGMSVPIPVAAVTKSDGEWLLNKGVGNNQWLETTQHPTDKMMAPFSSRGPVTTNWTIKPDIVAPGVNIWSTVPGGYEPLQGTSMAAPHVAGLVALIKEAHPDWTPEEVKAAILSSADLIEDGEEPYQPTEQGNGSIDMEEAVQPTLVLNPGALQFGRVMDAFFRKEKSVKLTNKSDRNLEVYVDQPKSKPGESWSVPGSFMLTPDETKEIDVELHLSKAFIEPGVHQGYLTVKTHDETFHLPYIYMKETADYAKVSGFELTQDRDRQVAYRFHLSEEVEEIQVDLYRAGTMLYHGELFHVDRPQAGMVEGEVDNLSDELEGNYIVVVKVIHNGKEDSYPFPVRFENE